MFSLSRLGKRKRMEKLKPNKKSRYHSSLDYDYYVEKRIRSLNSLYSLQDRTKIKKVSEKINEEKITENLYEHLLKEVVREEIKNNKKLEKEIIMDKIYKFVYNDVFQYFFKNRIKEFIPLTSSEIQNGYNKVFKPGSSRSEVLINHFNVKMTRSLLYCLEDGSWLNDEVINFYLKILIEKSEGKVHCFNTFFYFKLIQQKGYFNFNGVKKWTKKIDLFSKHKVIIPIHLGNHWACACVDFKRKRYEYYDSLYSYGRGKRILKNIKKYIEEEYYDKKGTRRSFDFTFNVSQSYPQQTNGYDCGVFTCKCANFLSQNIPITYSQRDMKYFRKKMCYEILNCHVL